MWADSVADWISIFGLACKTGSEEPIGFAFGHLHTVEHMGACLEAGQFRCGVKFVCDPDGTVRTAAVVKLGFHFVVGHGVASLP